MVNDLLPSGDESVYVLILKNKYNVALSVGALGEVSVEEGWIYYVGRSKNGWSSRIKRFQKLFTPHWHVDYLVDQAGIVVGGILPIDEPAYRECEISKHFAEFENISVLKQGFGASDCRNNCESHAWKTHSDPETVIQFLKNSYHNIAGWWEISSEQCRWNFQS